MFRRTREEQAARHQRVITQRDTAQALAEERLCTIIRLAGEVDALRDQLKVKPNEVRVVTELHRLTRAYKALEEQLLLVQRANEAQAAELSGLRTGVTS